MSSDLGSWTQVGTTGGARHTDEQLTDYEPSILNDFSGFLPSQTSDGQEPLAENYDAERV